MKKVFGIFAIAMLSGVITLVGYKLVEEPKVIERTVSPIQTVQTNFNPAFNNKNTFVAAPTDFTEAAEKTLNAVVHVKNTAIKSGISSWSDLFRGNRRQYEQVGTGSGVIISSDGYIVTNNHVIANANSIDITLNNRKKYNAKLIGTDVKNDIALLKIEADEILPYIPFSDSDQLKVGEWVLAVGNPYNLTSTVTAGIVSAKGRDLQGNQATDSFIQTDAAVNPGNSGGALVNTRGELVGINTAISSRTGSYVGYSFAVPSNIAKKIIDDLLEFGKVQEAVIGFIPEIKDDVEGVLIREISEEGNAGKAGLKAGDLIVKINNVKITKFSELTGQLTAKRPGQSVNVTVNRNGKLLTRAVKLIKRVERFISQPLQLEFKDLSKKELKDFDVSSGAKIIREGRRYEGNNSLIGYVVVKVNGTEVKDAADAVKLVDYLIKRGSQVRLEMLNPDGEVERILFR